MLAFFKQITRYNIVVHNFMHKTDNSQIIDIISYRSIEVFSYRLTMFKIRSSIYLSNTAFPKSTQT